jgi:hypothetical protein
MEMGGRSNGTFKVKSRTIHESIWYVSGTVTGLGAG